MKNTCKVLSLDDSSAINKIRLRGAGGRGGQDLNGLLKSEYVQLEVPIGHAGENSQSSGKESYVLKITHLEVKEEIMEVYKIVKENRTKKERRPQV